MILMTSSHFTFMLPTFAPPSSCLGDACRAQRNRGAVRYKDPEEGCCDPGWRRRVHNGGEESVSFGRKAPVLNTAALHFPDYGGWLTLHMPCMY